LGAYSAGSDPLTDKAMQKMPEMQAFLRQGLAGPGKTCPIAKPSLVQL